MEAVPIPPWVFALGAAVCLAVVGGVISLAWLWYHRP